MFLKDSGYRFYGAGLASPSVFLLREGYEHLPPLFPDEILVAPRMHRNSSDVVNPAILDL